MGAVVRVALSCLAALTLALMQSRGCGYTPDPAKGEGEPCTRTDECESHLTCSGGVCRSSGVDAGIRFDAGGPDDAGEDAGPDDAGPDDAGAEDAGPDDAGAEDAGADAG